jgi:hypothetical protein
MCAGTSNAPPNDKHLSIVLESSEHRKFSFTKIGGGPSNCRIFQASSEKAEGSISMTLAGSKMHSRRDSANAHLPMYCNFEETANVTSYRNSQSPKALSSMTTREAGKATEFSAEHKEKAEDLIRSVPSSKLKFLREEIEEKAPSPISRTVEGITTLFGSPKHRTIFLRCMKIEPVVEKPPAVRESRDVRANAEPAIVTTESGRQRLARRLQSSKSSSGIFVICDGASNVTDANLRHCLKTDLPRVETEEGTVKEVRLEQRKKASESILRILAGDSKQTIVKSVHHPKHRSPRARTLVGIAIERRCLQSQKANAGRSFKRELESKMTL